MNIGSRNVPTRTWSEHTHSPETGVQRGRLRREGGAGGPGESSTRSHHSVTETGEELPERRPETGDLRSGGFLTGAGRLGYGAHLYSPL